jgi:translation initiation factor 2B subunit (eIF-2B alpha/beta/delta family)/8-oxo-dGTP pyrophosphatase MutT (NUDIX family)
MKQVHVVTVLLCHKGKVCLVRRSRKVGTYKEHWSGISGYLEGDPKEHFMVELQEETSLTPYEYTLLRQADPVVIPDENHACIWYVHPFLCEVVDPSMITLDWENTELEWVDPDEIKNKDTVPGLREVYEKVSRVPLENKVHLFKQQLKQDKQSGARQIALIALDFLQKVSEDANAANAKTLLDDIAFVCKSISYVRPSMAIIATTLALVCMDISAVEDLDIDVAVKKISHIIERHRQDIETSAELAVKNLLTIIPEGSTVMVHSYSTSIVAAFEVLRDRHCQLIVTEARPGSEGRTTARMASEMGLDVTLITDALAAHALTRAKIVLLGVDSIEQDGSVINKAGSSLIAIAAHALGKKVYFLGEMRKISIQQESVELEEQPPEEVWENAPEGISVSNVYFDRTLPRYISGIILEHEIVEPYQIKKIARSIQAFSRDVSSGLSHG